jgi:hypothetical protein
MPGKKYSVLRKEYPSKTGFTWKALYSVQPKQETEVAMTDAKKDTMKEVETTMACSAFAEAGEPCPIGTKGETSGSAAGKSMEKEKTTLESVEKDFACTAFHDQNMACPINGDKK